MVNQIIEKMLADADKKLQLVAKELTRPDQDVVTYSICHASNYAIRDLLISLLAFNYSTINGNSIDINNYLGNLETWPIDKLITHSIAIIPLLAEVDFTEMNCSKLTKAEQQNIYCLSLDKVCRCSAIAEHVQDLVGEYVARNNHLTKH